MADPSSAPSSALEPRGTARPPRPTTTRVKYARIIAVTADVLQLAFFPTFVGGTLSPLDDVLDVVVAVIMVRLVGWHFAFLPTFVAELVPAVDLVPTWTAAVWFATRRGERPPR
jgi:hypothetical protein